MVITPQYSEVSLFEATECFDVKNCLIYDILIYMNRKVFTRYKSADPPKARGQTAMHIQTCLQGCRHTHLLRGHCAPNSKTGLSSSVHLLRLLIQSEHRCCIHNAVLYKLIRSVRGLFFHTSAFSSLVLYFDQLFVLEVQLKAATETIYFLRFICSLPFKPFDEENPPTTHLPGMIFTNLFFFL